MATTNGQIIDGILIPKSNITWADLANSPYATWENWTAWDGGDPTLPLTYTTDAVDFGRITDINVSLELEYQGTLTLTLKHSEDNSTYTDVTINASATVAGFSARYVKFALSLAGTDAQVSRIFATLSDRTQQETLQVNTTNLEGTSTARELPVQKNYSKVSTVIASAQSSGAYVATDYVDTGYVDAGEALFVSVVNVDATDSAGAVAPTIAVFDKDGNTEDAVVFVQITGLPQMVSDERKQITIQRTD